MGVGLIRSRPRITGGWLSRCVDATGACQPHPSPESDEADVISPLTTQKDARTQPSVSFGQSVSRFGPKLARQPAPAADPPQFKYNGASIFPRPCASNGRKNSYISYTTAPPPPSFAGAIGPGCPGCTHRHTPRFAFIQPTYARHVSDARASTRPLSRSLSLFLAHLRGVRRRIAHGPRRTARTFAGVGSRGCGRADGGSWQSGRPGTGR